MGTYPWPVADAQSGAKSVLDELDRLYGVEAALTVLAEQYEALAADPNFMPLIDPARIAKQLRQILTDSHPAPASAVLSGEGPDPNK